MGPSRQKVPAARHGVRISPAVNSDRIKNGPLATITSKEPVVADLFSGVGGVAKQVRLLGVEAVEIDIVHGPEHDMLKTDNQVSFMASLRAGHFRSVMIALDCKSFSRARRGRPPPVRSSDHIWGLPFLSEKDSDLLNRGNRLAVFVAKILRECIRRRILFVLENHLTSML